VSKHYNVEIEYESKNREIYPFIPRPKFEKEKEYKEEWKAFVDVLKQLEGGCESTSGSTANFIKCFRDYNNREINVNVGNDACSFINTLLRRFEDYVNILSGPRIIYYLFKSVIYEQSRCECGHKYQNATEYYIIPVIILDCKNLNESLKNNVVESEFNYNNCSCTEENNNQKKKMYRKNVFVKLPNTLIFHLYRFSAEKKKIMKKYEFPVGDDEILDMSKYSVEIDSSGKEKKENFTHREEYYKYKLVGIIIHAGENISSGHYISFVREREYKEDGKVEFGRWIEFNDNRVKFVNVSYVKENSFGGEAEMNDFVKKMNENDKKRFLQSGGLYKSNTAYALIYERTKVIDPLDNDFNNNCKKFPFLSVNFFYYNYYFRKSQNEVLLNNLKSEYGNKLVLELCNSPKINEEEKKKLRAFIEKLQKQTFVFENEKKNEKVEKVENENVLKMDNNKEERGKNISVPSKKLLPTRCPKCNNDDTSIVPNTHDRVRCWFFFFLL
jgi:hypothetical protein